MLRQLSGHLPRHELTMTATGKIMRRELKQLEMMRKKK
jgi:hypothetical protein